jgi:hypothetical protein
MGGSERSRFSYRNNTIYQYKINVSFEGYDPRIARQMAEKPVSFDLGGAVELAVVVDLPTKLRRRRLIVECSHFDGDATCGRAGRDYIYSRRRLLQALSLRCPLDTRISPHRDNWADFPCFLSFFVICRHSPPISNAEAMTP